MNILLTGGTGYIGSHTAVALTHAGHSVTLLDNLCNSSASVADRIAEIVGKRLPFEECDVRNTAGVREVLKTHSIDAVVHFAGLKAVGESVALPVGYYSNNVQGTVSLLQAMQAESVRSLVFSSSATVYGVPQYLPYDEVHPTAATNPYGRTKLHVEEMLCDLARSDDTWRIACLRYFNPVGAHESALIGEAPRGVPNNLMPFIAQVAIGQRAELKVFGNDYETPDGTGVRDYIHVMDLAEGHVAAFNYLANHTGCSAINLGTGRGYSVLEVIRTFESVNGCTIPYVFAPRRAGDIAAYYASAEQARKVLGWTAMRSLDEMCASTWQYYRTAYPVAH
jgi:UDP-glucose 4-epimerase